MWRDNGLLEAYLYVPPSAQPCEMPGIPGTSLDCDRHTGSCSGISLARGVAVFTPSAWHTVDLYVRMNGAGRQDGVVALALDGQTGEGQAGAPGEFAEAACTQYPPPLSVQRFTSIMCSTALAPHPASPASCSKHSLAEAAHITRPAATRRPTSVMS